MNIAPLPASERAAIAARYGIAVDRVPAVVTVCPPRTFTEAQEQATGWRAQIHAQVSQSRNANINRAQKAAKRRLAWLEHVKAGMTHAQAAAVVGTSHENARKYAKQLRAEGFDVPNLSTNGGGNRK